jgi:hypothetical protein
VEAASHGQLGALSAGGLAALAQSMRALAAQPSLSWVYAFVCAAYPRLDQFDGGQLNGLFEALPDLTAGAGGAGAAGGLIMARGGGGAGGGGDGSSKAGDVPRTSSSRWLDDLVQICCHELPARQAQRAALRSSGGGGGSCEPNGASSSSSSADSGAANGSSSSSSSRKQRAGLFALQGSVRDEGGGSDGMDGNGNGSSMAVGGAGAAAADGDGSGDGASSSSKCAQTALQQ